MHMVDHAYRVCVTLNKILQKDISFGDLFQ